MEKLGVDPAGLNKFIDDLEAGTEGLYAQMSEMLIKSRNENERRSLTTFYNWIVFGTREFSLKELGHLLELDKEYAGIDFNIEKEIREDRSSRYVSSHGYWFPPCSLSQSTTSIWTSSQ